MLSLRQNSEAGVTSPGASLGDEYGDPGVPNRQDPPLGIAGRIRRKSKPIRSVSAQLQELPDDVAMLDHPP